MRDRTVSREKPCQRPLTSVQDQPQKKLRTIGFHFCGGYKTETQTDSRVVATRRKVRGAAKGKGAKGMVMRDDLTLWAHNADHVP